MYQQYGNPTPPPVKKGIGGLAITGIVLAASLVSCTVGYAVGASGDKTSQRESLAGISSSPTHRSFTPIPVPETTTPEPVAYTPKPEDFTIEVKVTDSDCYNSLDMCSITYRVVPHYAGQTLPEDGSWTVSYRIIGGKTKQVSSFELTGDGKASVKQSEMIQTRLNPKLKAKVFQILSS